MEKPRLLFISNLFPDVSAPYRGLDNAMVLHHLAERWTIRTIALRPSLPFTARRWEMREEDAALNPEYLPVPYIPKVGSRFNHLLMSAALRNRLRARRGSWDAVLSSWLYPDSCAVARLAHEERGPFVAIAQGSDVHQYLQIPARRRAMMRWLPLASAIVTRSGELARLLADAGMPQAKLKPIYNGVDLDLFRPGARSAARAALGWASEGQVILFVGNFYAIKDPVRLVEAVATSESNARVVFAGGGPLRGEIEARASRLGVAARVRFSGRLEPREVALHMQAADVLCVPSRNEGVPNVILEAFACGLPVAASDVGGISEVLTGTHLGRLSRAGDVRGLAGALDAVLKNPPPAGPIAEHGRHFSWSRAAEEYHQLLAAAARAQAGPPERVLVP